MFGRPKLETPHHTTDGTACRNTLPCNGRKRLGGIRFGVEAVMPIERARLYREGGTHHKSPRQLHTHAGYLNIKTHRVGDRRATAPLEFALDVSERLEIGRASG